MYSVLLLFLSQVSFADHCHNCVTPPSSPVPWPGVPSFTPPSNPSSSSSAPVFREVVLPSNGQQYPGQGPIQQNPGQQNPGQQDPGYLLVCTTFSDEHFFAYRSTDLNEVLDSKNVKQHLVNACVGGGHCSHSVECVRVSHCLCAANISCQVYDASKPIEYYFDEPRVFETWSFYSYGEGKRYRHYKAYALNPAVGKKEIVERCMQDQPYSTDATTCALLSRSRAMTQEELAEYELAQYRAANFYPSSAGMLRIERGSDSHAGHAHVMGKMKIYLHDNYLYEFRKHSVSPYTSSSNQSFRDWKWDPRNDGSISGVRPRGAQAAPPAMIPSPNDPNLYIRNPNAR